MIDSQLFKHYTNLIKACLKPQCQTNPVFKTILDKIEAATTGIQDAYPQLQTLRNTIPEIRKLGNLMPEAGSNANDEKIEIINTVLDGLEEAVRREIAIECACASQTFKDLGTSESASLALLACDNLKIYAPNRDYSCSEVKETADCFTLSMCRNISSRCQTKKETALLKLLAHAAKISLLTEILTT